MKIIKKILSWVGFGDSNGSSKKTSTSKKNKKSSRAKSSTKNNQQNKGSSAKKQLPTSESKKTARKENSNKGNSNTNLSLQARKPKKLPLPYQRDVLNADVPEFVALGLADETLSAIKDMGYKKPTPIQEKSIGAVLSGGDIIATAQTGTGKTAAFALPIVDKIKNCTENVSVLVLSPTRELASQTKEAFDNFSKYVDVKSLLVQGGVSMNRQIAELRSGVDVVVATPGRLLDLLKQREISLANLKYLVLDEVDRMFDMGFIEDVSAIIRRCPKKRQTLFFSATMPDAVLRLSSWALNNPEKIDVGIVHSPADTIEHYVYPVDAIQKYDLLVKLLEDLTYESLIVFTRTRIDADRITQWLESHKYSVSTLHSDRTQKERDRALLDFKLHKTSILVATDIASRGLDISGVGCVINYNVPEHAEDYVHRIGRTGRANTEGFAITLYSSDETSFLKKIETFIGSRIERRKLDNFDYRTPPQVEEPVKRPRKRNK